jgi:tripartite-type tricarboxylate transporter receptor subunit TctC
VALAKARPGQLNYSGSGMGAAAHLAAELFKSMTGTNIVHIPYKSAAPALTDLMAGETQLMFATSLSVIQHIKANRVRALGVTYREAQPLPAGIADDRRSGRALVSRLRRGTACWFRREPQALSSSG